MFFIESLTNLKYKKMNYTTEYSQPIIGNREIETNILEISTNNAAEEDVEQHLQALSTEIQGYSQPETNQTASTSQCNESLPSPINIILEKGTCLSSGLT